MCEVLQLLQTESNSLEGTTQHLIIGVNTVRLDNLITRQYPICNHKEVVEAFVDSTTQTGDTLLEGRLTTESTDENVFYKDGIRELYEAGLLPDITLRN